MKKYSIGIDFGTLSVRAVLVDVQSGETVGEGSLFEYPHGVITSLDAKTLPPDYALQDPRDYTDALAFLLPDLLKQSSVSPDSIVGIGIDFTSCTVLPVDKEMIPICQYPEYSTHPHAYAKLWKHHGGAKYIDRINLAVDGYGKEMLESTGGNMASEFMIPKLYEVYVEAPEIYEKTDLFINAGDYVASVLAGGTRVHSMAYAVIKEHYDVSLGGYPKREFFASINEGFADVVNEKLNPTLAPVASKVGTLCKEWAEKTGLCEGIAIATPLIDAQSSIAAAGFEQGKALLVLGTSAVMAVNTKTDCKSDGVLSKGYGSAAPELYTLEAGLAAFGDLFDWFVKKCVPASYTQAAEEQGVGIHAYLRSLAERKRVGESGLIALDWWNGNRSVVPNERLSGLIVGLRISTPPEDIYRALIESCAYGLRRVAENFGELGIEIDCIAATGGIANKDPMLMQILSDVMRVPIEIVASKQSAALGAAIYGAVASGRYPDIITASRAMGCGFSKKYYPDLKNSEAYDELYSKYKQIYDYFARGDIMEFLFEKRL